MKKALVVLMVGLLATAASADIVAEWKIDSIEATPDVAGYETVVLSFRLYDQVAAAPVPFNSIQAKFTGTLNQVHPFDIATPFTDLNAAMADSKQDSQFMFPAPAQQGFDPVDTVTELNAGFAFPTEPGEPLPFLDWTPSVQLVIPTGTSIDEVFQYGTFEVVDQETGDIELDSYSKLAMPGTEFFFIPEPATMSLLALGGLAGLIRRRR
jgi:hypothetical protein